jgi:hypothetical protein
MNKKIYLYQTALASLGFNPGTIDGEDGPQTKAALKKWKDTAKPGKSALVILLQTGLTLVGSDPGPIDGVEGPRTKTAFDNLQPAIAQPEETVTEEIVAPSSANITKQIVTIAAREVGIRERSKNQGPGIEKYWGATTYKSGYANREPYCAAFLCWVFREACKGIAAPFSLPRSPVAYDFEKWGKSNASNGVETFSSKGKRPRAGDVFTLSAASHVGLVKSVGKTTFTSIEANTNDAGSREGDGVYERTRSIASVRRFVRCNA